MEKIMDSTGKSQALTAFLLCCAQLPISFNDHLFKIYAWTPPHRCRVSPSNHTTHHTRPVIRKLGKVTFSSCSMYLNPLDPSMGSGPCIYGWQFLHLGEEWTLTTEWDLVCEREYLISMVPYIYETGAMLGGLIAGFLADRYGRRPLLLISLLLHTLTGLALHFVPSFAFFAAGYTLQGFFVTAIQCTSLTLLLETVAFPYHLKITACLCFVTPLAVLVLAVVAWLVRNWRYIQLAIAAPGIVCLGYFWLLSPSLPWLVSKGRTADAERQLTRLARFNKTVLPQDFRNHLNDLCSTIADVSDRHSFGSAVSWPRIRRYTFLIYYMWFVSSLESNSSFSDLPALKDNRYAVLFVNGLMNAGMIMLLYFVAQRFGPRFCHGLFLMSGGLCCLSSALLGYSSLFNMNFDILGSLTPPVLSVVGKATVRAVLVTNIFFTLKAYPTGVRAVALGSCLLWSRTARLIGTHISSMEDESPHFFPLALVGSLCAIGGGLTPFLLSDYQRPLPHVAKEIEEHLVLRIKKGMTRRESSTLSHRATVQTSTPMDTDTNDPPPLVELSPSQLPVLHGLDPQEPGPSGSNFRMRPSSESADTESRLTDLEEELGKIWETNVVKEDDEDSLKEFRCGDVREHYYQMHETRF